MSDATMPMEPMGERDEREPWPDGDEESSTNIDEPNTTGEPMGNTAADTASGGAPRP